MRRVIRGATALAAMAGTAAIAQGQAEVTPQRLTIERIFASPALSGPSPRKPELSPDGRWASLLKPRADDAHRFDLWIVDTTTGAQRMLIDTTRVGSGAALSEAEKMRRERERVGNTKGIVDYEWAPDGKAVLAPIDGDLYLATLDGTVRKLTTGEAVIDPHVSASGRYVSFVKDQNLFAIDVASGQETQLTHQGGGTVTCGTAEFVAQEEMSRFTGTWWAPGDRRVAVECYDEAKVKVVTRAAIGADGTRSFDQRYPAAGTPNVAVTVWLMDADGGNAVKADLGSDPDIYLARANWAPDARALYLQRQTRDQKRLDVLTVDPATGGSKTLFSETAKTWVNLTDDFRALSDGSFLWGSERDGYMHLYRFNRGRWRQLTRGPWMVEMNGQSENTGVVGVDEARHRVFFVANKDTPLEAQLYAVDYLHPKAPERLTEAGYWNDVAMDDDATHMLVTRSSPTQPPQVYIADAAGQRTAWVEENRLDANHPYAPYKAAMQPTTFGTLKADDGSTLYYEMITPKLEPGKTYPVFFEHYGGPGAQEVRHVWEGGLPQYWASKGWIYFKLDNRGSANRGRAFEDQIYHAMGTVEVADQATGARWLKTQPFVDASRIATFGWSYGGYMTLKMLEADKAGLYRAGVSVAPVTRWELYDTHYTDQYLGDPAAAGDVYKQSDALDQAPNIKAPFLLVHGLSDDNVVFENSAALINRLQETDHPFDMALYVGQTHSINGPNRQADVWHVIERYLDRTVLGQNDATWTPVAPAAGQ